MPNFPDPDDPYPLGRSEDGQMQESVVFLKAAIAHPRITVGDYTYASSFDPPENWASRLAPYLFDTSAERLIIGKFCQIADSVRFITASANHRYDGISSYPFAAVDMDFGPHRSSLPGPGPDTVIGHDVWLGYGATVLPGARLGNGVIVGAGAVVGGEVPPYTIVAGNPARAIRTRFTPTEAKRLIALAWWNWPIAHILDHEALICGGDIDALEQAAP